MRPGRMWLRTDWGKNRAAVYRALRISPDEPGAAYATGPFVVMKTDGGEKTWIAGAVGIWCAFDPSDWEADDITEVVLWNPKTGDLGLLCDEGSALVLPDEIGPRLSVYADGFTFFRAWADRRAATLARILASRAVHRATIGEPRDSNIPGALVIGDIAKLPWHSIGASVLAATPGVDAKALNRAIIRSAHLPRVESLAA